MVNKGRCAQTYFAQYISRMIAILTYLGNFSILLWINYNVKFNYPGFLPGTGMIIFNQLVLSIIVFFIWLF